MQCKQQHYWMSGSNVSMFIYLMQIIDLKNLDFRSTNVSHRQKMQVKNESSTKSAYQHPKNVSYLRQKCQPSGLFCMYVIGHYNSSVRITS